MVDVVHQPLTNFHSKSLRLLAVLKVWRQRIREREQLARLGERELRDIGLSRAAIYAEISKPFWRR